MKRNESILVYSVTGLLVVILAVAILFGNDNSASASELSKGLDDLELVRATPKPNVDGVSGAQPDDAVASGSITGGPDTGGPEGAPSAPPGAVGQGADGPGDKVGGAKAEGENAAAAKVASADKGPPVAGVGGASNPATDVAAKPPSEGLIAQPLVAPAKPSVDAEAANQALVLLGDSRRDGDYRIVTVRRGDTFSELVQRWCGNLDALPLAESLNEEANLANLKEGTKLCMPWVEDGALVAAHQARRTKVETESKVLNEARAQGRVYTVKSGDKLWNIAVAQVGQKNAAKFIEQIKALNPELMTHPDRLVVGKTILLPQR